MHIKPPGSQTKSYKQVFLCLKKRYLIILFVSLIFFSGCLGQERSPGTKMKEPTISLYIAASGETKQIKMEEYVKGVVAAEMTPTWPENALAAQAILARTFTLERMKEEGGVPQRGTDASTDVEEFQAYDPDKINDAVSKAVEKHGEQWLNIKVNILRLGFLLMVGGKLRPRLKRDWLILKNQVPMYKVCGILG